MNEDTIQKANSVQFNPPRKQKYADERKLYLTKEQVEKLAAAAASTGRHGERDALMIMTAYRHGMRASELVNLRRVQIDTTANSIAIVRKKNGKSGTHPFVCREERKQWLTWLKQHTGEFVFEGERGPLTERAFFKIVQRAGELAGFDFPVNPHALRHATGYELINKDLSPRMIQNYLGHKDIKHTMRYTELAPNAFNKVKDML